MQSSLKSVVEEVGDHFCRTKFIGTPEGEELINKIFDIADMEFNGLEPIIIGSIIAMNAYPGRVAGMVPCPGLERVAPADKRMRTDMFNIA